MSNNTEILRGVMSKHSLRAEDVAKLLRREPNTVRVWRVRETKRPIPNDALALLIRLVEPAPHE